MIADTVEMKVARHQLKILEEALKALRSQLGSTNPDLLGVTEKAYIRRIDALQTDISRYLRDHPNEA